ncbi:MAG: molybdenum cofactor biosynthesis protein [Deferribacteraceae bacterium]|jgi:molybdenum cofactor synthesis domain-containing protein|nr:molybdenum cofactor biosynthesis protein [Deferribacteraceae bacterium]
MKKGETNNGKINYISISNKKGVPKTNVTQAKLVTAHGLDGDAHAGDWHRQVSLLAQESIDKIRAKGVDVSGGAFAENITTWGVDIPNAKVGEHILLDTGVELVVSQIGKVCHARCSIYKLSGDCVMPREGIFAEVLKGGEIRVGSPVETVAKKGFSVGLITLSDRACHGVYPDETGPAIERYLKENLAISYVRKELVPDEEKRLELILTDFCDIQKLDLIITNGSTGASPRDIAPEALLNVITRRLPGYEEAMRAKSREKTINAIISRAVCGLRGSSLIISVPGSPKAALENLEAVLGAVEHTIKKAQGDETSCG